MKPKANPFIRPALLTAASFALAVSVRAATSIDYSYATIANSSDTSWVSGPANSTSVVAMNFGSGGYTSFGGVTWRPTYVGGGGSNSETAIHMNFYRPGAWATRNDTYYSGDSSNILNEGQYGNGSDYRLDLSGFTVGQNYQVQFVLADTRGGAAGRAIIIDGISANIASQDSTSYTYAYTDGKFAVVTAAFAPAAGDTDFTFRPVITGSTEVQMNALQVIAAETNVAWNNNASNMTWSSSAANWSVGPGWQYATNNAVFGATGVGTVNLAENLGVHNVTFDAAGYTIAGNTLTLNNSTITANADAAISSALAGSTGLIKAGSGILTLSGTNTYTGATNVNAGKLLINGNNSAATGAVNVAAGTVTGTSVATLGGSGTGSNGTIGGNVVLAAESASGFKNGGVLAPTAAASGNQLSVAGTTTFGAGSIFEWSMSATDPATDPGNGTANSGSYGQLAGTGAISGSDAVFKIVLGSGNDFTDAFWNTNKTWNNILTGAGAPSALTSIFSSISGSGITFADNKGTVDGQGYFTLSGTSTSLTWTAVPEPTSALAGLLITAGLLRRRRR